MDRKLAAVLAADVVGCSRLVGDDEAGTRRILGGTSTGRDIVVRFAVKPTSLILTPRRSIDRFGNEVEVSTKGRHDPSVGIRTVPVGEAMLAIVLAGHLLRQRALGDGR
jgi:chorismate synthase